MDELDYQELQKEANREPNLDKIHKRAEETEQRIKDFNNLWRNGLEHCEDV